MRNRLGITVTLAGLVGFLYPLQGVINDLDNWSDWNQPHTAAKLITCIIFALLAVGGALGIDLDSIKRSLLAQTERGSLTAPKKPE